MSGKTFKKNTISLHGILSTHVFAKFNTDWNWHFRIFHEYLKMERNKWIKVHMPFVCNMCKQYLYCNVKWRHSVWCYWRRLRQTSHTISISESYCRRCKFVSKRMIYDHLYLPLLLFCSRKPFHVHVFFNSYQKLRKNDVNSKFWFPPLNFLAHKVLRYIMNTPFKSINFFPFITSCINIYITWLWIKM